MVTVVVKRVIRGPLDKVFDVLTDHEGYTRFRGVTSARLAEVGAGERNGTGALRVIKAGAFHFEEEIVGFERPTLMEYRIRKSTPPLEHTEGRMTFRATDGGTEVVWLTTFRVTTPVIENALTLAVKQLVRLAFGRMLDQVDRELRAAA